MKNTMIPEIEEQLKGWNKARLEIIEVRGEIERIQIRAKYLQGQMDSVALKLENTLFNLEQPFGLKIGGDYIVVIQDPQTDNFVIQTVDFNLREELL